MPPLHPSSAIRSALGLLATVLANLAMVSAPLLLLLGRSRFSIRQISAALLLASAPAVALRLRRVDGQTRKTVLQAPLLVALLLLLSYVLDDHRAMLAMPVLINAALLLSFASSLRGEMPIVESFARMVEPALTAPEVAYCRTVTQLWCVFFLLNGGAAAMLALFAPFHWWAIFTGGISYLLMGGLFFVEFLVRKVRFRRYGRGPHDLILARLFPPRAPRP